ncbi:MAG TPA: hypothetical protein VK593_00140, partial [Edaphobacter sp.]|nr:hypothetical protein [Edaphobacter sp.]
SSGLALMSQRKKEPGQSPGLVKVEGRLRRRLVCRALGGGGDGPVRVAYLEAGEAAHADVLAELCHARGDDLRDGLRLLLMNGWSSRQISS